MRATSGDLAGASGAAVLACQSDRRLVALCRDGHDAAFEAIVRRYRRPLLAYARRLLGDGRAEDAVQQAFLNAYRAIASTEAELELRPWLYRITHNATLDALRPGRLETVALNDERDGVERPDEAFERRQRMRDVVAAVQGLPQRQRDALVLRELEGRGHDEIALQLGVTGGAVRQLIHRARISVRAGVSAVMPFGLVESLARGSAGEAVAARLPDLVAAGAATTTVAKAGVAMLVVGGMAGGGAAVTSPETEARADRVPAAAQARNPASSSALSPADAARPAKTTPSAALSARAGRDRKRPRRADARGSGERAPGDDAPAQRKVRPAAAPLTGGTARGVPTRRATEREIDASEDIEPEDVEEVEEPEPAEPAEPEEPAEPADIELPEPIEADDDAAVEDAIDD